jgi:hypothetical protein
MRRYAIGCAVRPFLLHIKTVDEGTEAAKVG